MSFLFIYLGLALIFFGLFYKAIIFSLFSNFFSSNFFSSNFNKSNLNVKLFLTSFFLLVVFIFGACSSVQLSRPNREFSNHKSSFQSRKISPNRRGEYVEYIGGRLLWPLEKPARLISGFGPRGRRFHDGLDIAAPIGTSILSVHSGVVAYSDSKLRGFGKMVVIKGDDNLVTVYAHNKKNIVKKGDRVKRGQKIAEVGMSGHADAPHLHFEVRTKDSRGRAVAIDPVVLLKPGSKEKPGFRVNESLNPVLAWLDR